MIKKIKINKSELPTKELISMVGIQVPKDDLNQLRNLAFKEDRSLSSLIRRIIKEYLVNLSKGDK